MDVWARVSGFDQQHGSSVNPARQAGPHAHCRGIFTRQPLPACGRSGHGQGYDLPFRRRHRAFSANGPAPVSVAPGSGPRHLRLPSRWPNPIRRQRDGIERRRLPLRPLNRRARTFSDRLHLARQFPRNQHRRRNRCQSIGTIVYASNRGADTLALFTSSPQRLSIAPMERVCLPWQSAALLRLRPHRAVPDRHQPGFRQPGSVPRPPRTGELRPTGPIVTGIPKPACIVFAR